MLYCSQNSDAVLSWAYKILEKNSKIVITELDYDWIYVYPPNPIIEKLFSVHRHEFEKHGADCSMGKNFHLNFNKQDSKTLLLM